MSFILSFIFGALSGAIATFLGLYKFYREKWWDKQFNIFSDVVDHFYTISICIERLQYEIEKNGIHKTRILNRLRLLKRYY